MTSHRCDTDGRKRNNRHRLPTRASKEGRVLQRRTAAVCGVPRPPNPYPMLLIQPLDALCLMLKLWRREPVGVFLRIYTITAFLRHGRPQ
jgi:hypothetical protein